MRKMLSILATGVVMAVGPAVAYSMSSAKEGWLITEAKKAVTEKMRDPDSAKFSDLKAIDNPPVVCGIVNAKNAFGGYAGPQRFLSNGTGGITFLESEMDVSEFSKAWDQLCN